MQGEYGNLLKITFIIHAIIGFIFGLGFLLVPDMLATLYGLAFYIYLESAMPFYMGWNDFTAPALRAFGAIILAFAIGSILCLIARSWGRVKIVVEMEIIWTSIGTIVFAYHMYALPGYNVYGWINVGILLFLFILFLISYLKEMRYYAPRLPQPKRKAA